MERFQDPGFRVQNCTPKPAGCSRRDRDAVLCPKYHLLVLLLVLLLFPAHVLAQPPKADEPPKADNLAGEQERVANDFSHLEDVLLRMAELTAGSDPRRAALLKRAVAESKERLVDSQFQTLVELLKNDRLSQAIKDQKAVTEDLQSLLELLLRENRADRLRSEKDRIRAHLKELGEIINRQKSLQSRSVESDDPQRLAGQQGSLAEKTGNLAREMRTAEEPDTEANGAKPDGAAKPSEDQNGRPEGDDAPPSDSQGDDAPPGQNGSEPQGQPSPQQRLEAARDRMREAQEKLDAAQREGAVEKQEEAIRNLEQAKAELEEILRQLREEELTRMLTSLQDRFRRMLAIQQEIYDATRQLDKVPADQRDRGHAIEAGRLASREAQIGLEADKAMTLLGEDGTSRALPEALGQMQQDIRQVTGRLSRAEIGTVTQTVEEDIIAALQEMIDAMEKALKDQEKRQQQSQSQQSGQPQESPLVDLLAEIKMIRSLQIRVNRRTQQYSEQMETSGPNDAELLQSLGRLAEQQERIHEVTRELGREANP